MVLKYLTKRQVWFLILLFALLITMAWYDVTSSNQAGLKDVNRSTAHIFIGLSVGIQGFYCLFFKRRVVFGGKALNRILFIILLWFIVVDIMNERSLKTCLPNIIMALWWIIAYNFSYSFCKNNPDCIKVLLFFFMIMNLLWIFLNMYARFQIVTNFGWENAITGYAYYLIIFLPFVYLLQNGKLKTIFVVVSVITVVSSFKRGTIVTLPVMFFVYYLVSSLKEGSLIKILKYSVLIIILASVTLSIGNHYSGGYLSERFSNEELKSGSGRAEYRTIAIQSLANRDSISLLFGSGHWSSVELVGSGLHNEWLEFLYCFGIIGFLLYFVLGIALISIGLKAYRYRSPYGPHLFMAISYFYMVGLFSGFYGVYVTFYFFSFLGMISYLNEKYLFTAKRKI